MTEQEAYNKALELLPYYKWHDVPESKFSDSDPTKLTRCIFCLKFFELLESQTS